MITRHVHVSLGCSFIAALLLSSQAIAHDLWSSNDNTLIGEYATIYAADWESGLDPAIVVQAAEPNDITVVVDPLMPARRAVNVDVRRDEDFSRVANGLPRAELLLPPTIGFASGHDYLIRWATFLPADFSFDLDQMQIITQIHQSAETGGPPPFMLTLLGTSYTVSERGGHDTVHGHGPAFCCADHDTGKWVRWVLHYVPDATGRTARTQLWKNGVEVFESKGLPNAYPGETHAYLKLGVYKPGWLTSPSTISETRLLYGPLTIAELRK
jgi:Polysaccharide lyase